ncbi:telomeric repeat binding factor a isoform X2 [Paramisgurnus dabryanus]|uniref:telomeric repeat binding factor a isoform X2 n=1 Tax=Paramisgurnus dabryanus TaxID=90735 RepID=UPI0031F349E7
MSECRNSSDSLHYEQILNRWYFDYQVFKAFNAFRNGNFTAFTEFINIVEDVVVRPMDGRSDIIVKLRFLQFLSRINHGDRFDITFEDPLTPLESALNVLKSICRDMKVPQRDHDHISNSIKEMLVIVCIKGGEFERAQQMIHKHFPKGMDSAGKKLYMNLIRNRRRSHSILQINSYSDFKQDMLDFIERLYSIPEPFLIKMLMSREIRTASDESPQISGSVQNHNTAENTNICSTSPPSGSTLPPAASAHVSLQNLRLVYSKLSEVYGVSVPFSQLQQEVENKALLEYKRQTDTELHLVLSETQPESNDTDQDSERMKDVEVHLELQNNREQDSEAVKDMEVPGEQCAPVQPRYNGMTISRLVLEDDSQVSENESQDDVMAQDEESTQITPVRSSPRTQSGRRRVLSPESHPETPTRQTRHSCSTSVSHTHPGKRKETPTRQTCQSNPLSVNHTHAEQTRETPPRQTRQSSSHAEKLRATPARKAHQSSSPSVSHVHAEKQNQTPTRQSSPPPVSHAHAEKQNQTPTRQSSPPPVSHAHAEKKTETPKRHTRQSSSSSVSHMHAEKQTETPTRQSSPPSVCHAHAEKQTETPVRKMRHSSSPSVSHTHAKKQSNTPVHQTHHSSPLSVSHMHAEKQNETPARQSSSSSVSHAHAEKQIETPTRQTHQSSSSSVSHPHAKKQNETPARQNSSSSVSHVHAEKQRETPARQTRHSSPPSVSHMHAKKHRNKRPRIVSSPESELEEQTEAQRETHNSRSTSGEKPRETSARHSSPPSVSHTHRKKRQNKRNRIAPGPESDSDQQTEDETETPVHQTPDKQQDKRLIVVCDSDSDFERQTEVHHDITASVNHSHPEKQRGTHNSGGKKHKDKRPRIVSDSDSDSQRETNSHLSSIIETHTEKQRERTKRWLNISGTREDWSDEESLFGPAAGSSRKEKQTRKKWTVEESNWLKDGVLRFGEGRWGKIHSAFPFKDRTPVNLKDRWRTMKKLKLV